MTTERRVQHYFGDGCEVAWCGHHEHPDGSICVRPIAGSGLPGASPAPPVAADHVCSNWCEKGDHFDPKPAAPPASEPDLSRLPDCFRRAFDGAYFTVDERGLMKWLDSIRAYIRVLERKRDEDDEPNMEHAVWTWRKP